MPGDDASRRASLDPLAPAGNTAVDVRTFTIRSRAYFSTGSIRVATALYSMPELTQAVVDGGIVTGYWDLGSGANDDWWQLPDVLQHSDGNVRTVTFIYATGEVGLQVTSSASSDGTGGRGGYGRTSPSGRGDSAGLRARRP